VKTTAESAEQEHPEESREQSRAQAPSSQQSAGASAARVHVARRAIFARDLSVWGYELMYGGEAQLSAEMAMLNALAELGVKSFVADKHAVISVSRDTLVGRLPLPASSEGTLLVLRCEGDPVDGELLEAADARLDEGFQLALSGELWSPSAAPLIERASILRVPYGLLQLDVLARIGPRPRGQQLWVDGVDMPEDFPATRRYAPNYFSGDFLLKPSPIEGKRAPRNLSVLMELMNKLRQPDVGFAEIENILRRDAGLSVTLLRFLNSAGFGLRVQVNNIRQAVALLGLNEFSKWVTLVGLGDASYKPPEVLLTALVRAKTCELVAAGGVEAPAMPSNGTAFMVGLFSLLDAMLDQPLEAILKDLPVSDNLRHALLDQSGPEGEILAAVLDYERGFLPESLPLATGDMFECWQRAVQWADSLRGALPGDGPRKAARR
jgi:EAL and modified HD-GYP domain-containing signal transduction protein